MADKEEKTEKAKKPASRNKKIRKIAVDIIMVCLAGIMVVSGINIYRILKSYKDNRAVYEKLPGREAEDSLEVDFGALKEINPDVIGWLYYEDTPIDYPVVQGEDNSKYLDTLFDGTWGIFGTLFADAEAEAPFRQFNTVIYGHHMKDGSMFCELEKLKDQKFCEEHPRLELITPEGKYHLEIWAFLNQPSDSDIYQTNISDPDEKQEYITLVEELASYTTDVSVGPYDKLVLLSTCAYEYQNARYIVVCKMVPNN